MIQTGKHADRARKFSAAPLTRIALDPSFTFPLRTLTPTTTVAAIAHRKPSNPVFAFRPHCIERAVRYFQQHFHAKPLYAVKTNPDPQVIYTLKQLGVQTFDVASLAEVKLVRSIHPSATLYFMHPVKAPEAIAAAYFDHQVRHFSLDSMEEAEKILQATHQATDLHLHVRLGMESDFAEIKLSKKFGTDVKDAAALLTQLRPRVAGLGLSFHVGSQCSDPQAYTQAIQLAEQTLHQSGQRLDYLNVGGGFPSIYPNMQPPALRHYFEAIHQGFARLKRQHPSLTLLSEPGRALVAEAFSLIVRVELRKQHHLYITDGTYGSLFDAGTPNFIFPTRLLRSKASTSALAPFHFFGPTCDSMDYMHGPFLLPNDVQTGDYLEIGQLGAYSKSLASYFNGFRHEEELVMVSDEPLLSMYDPVIHRKGNYHGISSNSI